MDENAKKRFCITSPGTTVVTLSTSRIQFGFIEKLSEFDGHISDLGVGVRFWGRISRCVQPSRYEQMLE